MHVNTILYCLVRCLVAAGQWAGDKTHFLDKLWRLNAANGDVTLHRHSSVGHYTAQGVLCRNEPQETSLYWVQ